MSSFLAQICLNFLATVAGSVSPHATCLSAVHTQSAGGARDFMRVSVLTDRRGLTDPAAARSITDYGVIWCDLAHFLLTSSSALASFCSLSAHFSFTFGLTSREQLADQAPPQRSPATTIRHGLASTFRRLTARRQNHHDPYLLRGRQGRPRPNAPQSRT